MTSSIAFYHRPQGAIFRACLFKTGRSRDNVLRGFVLMFSSESWPQTGMTFTLRPNLIGRGRKLPLLRLCGSQLNASLRIGLSGPKGRGEELENGPGEGGAID